MGRRDGGSWALVGPPSERPSRDGGLLGHRSRLLPSIPHSCLVVASGGGGGGQIGAESTINWAARSAGLTGRHDGRTLDTQRRSDHPSFHRRSESEGSRGTGGIERHRAATGGGRALQFLSVAASFAIRRLPPVAYRQPSTDHCPLPTYHRPPPAAHRPPTTAHRPPPTSIAFRLV